MNPYVLLAALVLWVASVGGAYFKGQGDGHDSLIAKQQAVGDAIKETREAAQAGAAAAIAEMKPINTTIYQKATHEIRTNTIYADCRHPLGMLDSINSAITGSAKPASPVSVPASSAARR